MDVPCINEKSIENDNQIFAIQLNRCTRMDDSLLICTIFNCLCIVTYVNLTSVALVDMIGGTVWYDPTMWYGVYGVWYGVWYGVYGVWYGMVWYGMVWYGMVYGTVCYCFLCGRFRILVAVSGMPREKCSKDHTNARSRPINMVRMALVWYQSHISGSRRYHKFVRWEDIILWYHKP